VTCILRAIGAIFCTDARWVFSFRLDEYEQKMMMRDLGGSGGGGGGDLFGVGGTQELAPCSNGLMLFEYHNSYWPASHKRHQAVKKWFALVLFVELRCLVRGQRDRTLPQNSETWIAR
jgi:hypothetical protein